MSNYFQILHQIFFLFLYLSTIDSTNTKIKLGRNNELDLTPIGKRVVRQPNCRNNNRIKYCTEETEENPAKYPVPVSKRVLQRFISLFETNCKYDSIDYTWKITSGYPQDFDEKSNVLQIPPFTLRNHKKYRILSSIQLGNNGFDVGSPIIAECDFEVNAELAIAVVASRSNHSVQRDSTPTLDASLSIDRDVPKGQPGNLEYFWKCEFQSNENSKKESCQTFTTKLFMLSLSQMRKGIYTFKLQVRNVEGTEWSTTSTVLYEKQKVTELLIECLENCPPAAYPSVASALTTVTANCLTNCEEIVEDSFEWSVNIDGFPYEESTQFGRNNYKFSILPQSFRSGKTYTLTVIVKKNPDSYAEIILNFPSPPRIDSCSVIPRTGTAVTTKFSLQCKFTGDIIEISVFTQKDHNNMVLAKGPSIDDLTFSLAMNSVPFLKVTDKNSLTQVTRLDVRVNPLIKPSNPESMAKDILNVMKDISQKEGEETVQILSGVVEELHNSKDQIGEHFEPTRQKLLQKISEVDQGQLSAEESMAVATIVSRLNEDSDNESHPESAVISSKICKNAANSNMEQLQKEHFPTSLVNETKNATKVLMSCPEHDVTENMKILEEAPDIVLPTTPFPLLPEEVITEDYPNYADDNREEREQMYKVATDNFINICSANVKSLVMTTRPSDKMVTVLTKACEVAVTRKLGYELLYKTIETNDTTIKPSEDFGKFPEDIIDVMICTWANRLFWWKPNSRQIVSKVIFLKFSIEGKEINKFTSPVQLIFNTKKTNPNFKIHTVKFPEAGAGKFEKDQDMAIIRVDVKKFQSFFVEFVGLAAEDLYDVIISDFRKIRFEDFKTQSKKVSKQHHVLFQEHNHDYDGWHYISVVQNKKMATFKPEFKISVYTVSCFSWSDKQQSWITSCQGSSESNVEQIVCNCWHLSILAGAAYNNSIKIDHFVIEPDFTLDLMSNSILIIALIALFALYCSILAICFRKRKVLGRNVFLLSDLVKENKYKYFVEIKTGAKWRSGTTSNICVRIYGTKDKTKSHLVNFPDPEKRILQKNNCDWFLLTTKRSLGEIVSVAVWSDCSGRQPSWFCKDITVFDLQTGENWYFLVDKWIRLPPKGKYFVRVQPMVKEVNVFKKFFKWIQRGDWNFAIVSNLSAFKLCTVVLSTFLTIYVLTLFLYGLPSLKLSDAFTPFSEFRLHFQVFLNGFITSSVSFLVHICVIWVFRQEAENNQNSKFFKLTKISWWFLAGNITISIIILVIFGFWLPEITAWFWLTSTIEAIILYFLFLLLVSKVYSMFFAHSNRKIDYEFESMKMMASLMQDHLNRLYYKFGDTILRPYIHHVYKLMDKEVVAKKRKYYAARAKLLILVEDIIMFSVYLTLLFLTIFANQDFLAVKGHESMADLVVGTVAQTAALEDISDFESFYDYVNETLINALHSPQWYSKYIVDEPGMMIDFTNKYLGVARFRQLRVQPDKKCRIPEVMHDLYGTNESCRAEYTRSSSDWSGFGRPEYKPHRLAAIWNYTKQSTAGSLVVFGEYATYPGGGYIATLGRTMYNSLVNLAYLKEHRWLDEYTRVVFIEFLTYSANSNLFNAVRITFEKGATGAIFASCYVNTRKLLFAEGERKRTENIISAAFLIVVVILTIKVLMRIVNSERKLLHFWKDLWTLVDLSIVAMSYACVVIFVHRQHLIQEFLDATEKAKKNEFVHYFDFFNEDFLFMMVAAFLVFVATIRLWKLVRFGQVFKVMEKTIKLSFCALMVLFMNHVFVIMAFSLSGRVMLGDMEHEFKDVTRTVITLSHFCLGMFGDFDFTNFQRESGFFGPLHYSLYMICSLAFCTMYEAILMLAYYEAKVSLSNDDEFDAVTTFLYNEYRYYRKFFRGKFKRLRGGGNEEKSPYVTAKEDVHRYANATTLPKHQINVMKEVVKYRLLEDEVGEKQNLKQMVEILKTYFEDVDEEENEMFFCGKIPDNRIRLVYDGRLLKIERIVGILLSRRAAVAVQKQQNKKIARIVAKTETIKEIIDSMNVLMANITII